MKSLSRILLAAILISGATVCWGQKNLKPAYIIGLKNDTTRGFIDLRGDIRSSGECLFYDSRGGSLRRYLPGEIKGYGFLDGRFYVSHTATVKEAEKQVFLEYLLKGIISLYYLREIDGDHYYIEKEGKIYELTNEKKVVKDKNDEFERSYQVQSNQFKGVLTYLFFGTKEIIPEVQKATFDRKSLIKISLDYHNLVCKDKSCEVFAGNGKTMYFSIGPAMRYEFYNTIKFGTTLAGYKFTADPELSAGVAMNFRLTAINEKLNLGIKSLYSRAGLNGINSEKNLVETTVTKYHLNDNRLLNSAELSYRLPGGKFHPFAGIGYGMGIGLGGPSSFTTDVYDSGGSLKSETIANGCFRFRLDVSVTGVAGFLQEVSRRSVFVNLFVRGGRAFYKETLNQVLTHNNYYSAKTVTAGIEAGFLF
ncbi:MAG TPA: hypothetical protein VMT63_11185 [Bacteroidales bacterium]|nr:hypothetical protein [Bacteroidales bacterium]